MSEVTNEMRETLRELSQSMYYKIKECRKKEKSTWKKLADMEEHVETIYKQIDIITNELVSTC